MAKLTDVRDTPEIANGAKVIAVPVKGGTTIYQGALVALDASGYAIPGKKAESLTAVGRAEETVTNTGADGELVIRVARGVFVFDNTATAANKITAAHVLKPCYQQLQYTVKVQCTIRQQLEKFCRLFCGQCVNGLFLFLGCADLSHWILRYHFLLFGVAKYQIERSV